MQAEINGNVQDNKLLELACRAETIVFNETSNKYCKDEIVIYYLKSIFCRNVD